MRNENELTRSPYLSRQLTQRSTVQATDVIPGNPVSASLFYIAAQEMPQRLTQPRSHPATPILFKEPANDPTDPIEFRHP